MDEQPTKPPAPEVSDADTPAPVVNDIAAPPAVPQPTSEPTAAAPDEQTPDTPTVSSSSADSTPPVAPTPAEQPKGSHWLRTLLLVVVVIVLLGAGVFVAMRLNKPVATQPVTVKKDVALVRLGTGEPLPSVLYPDSSGDSIVTDVNNQIFEGLTQFNAQGHTVPSLATSWSNPDSSTWLFKLRQGVHFHDGQPLTAQAVVDSFNASHSAFNWGQYGTTIKDVTAVDAQTVKITTDGPDPILTSKLTGLYVFDAKGQKDSPANGTGAYTVKPGTTISQSGVDLAAYDQYWGGSPHVKEVKFINFASTADVLAAGKQNKLDIVQIENLASLGQLSNNYYGYSTKANFVAYLVPNTLKAGPLANKTVRQAIYTALDPQALMKAHGDTGQPATQLVTNLVAGYDPAIKRPATDVAKAKSLLTQAGYPNGFSFTLTYFKSAQSLADEVKKELATAGITVNEDPQTVGKALAQKAFSGGTDMYYVSENSNLLDLSDIVEGFIFQQNNYKSAQLTQLDKQSSTELNPAKRLALLKQESDVVMNDYGILPMYEPNSYNSAVNKNLHFTQEYFAGEVNTYFRDVYGQ